MNCFALISRRKKSRTGNFGNCCGDKGSDYAENFQFGIFEVASTHTIEFLSRAIKEHELSSDQPPGVVEQEVLHQVDAIGYVRFHVEFYHSRNHRAHICGSRAGGAAKAASFH